MDQLENNLKPQKRSDSDILLELLNDLSNLDTASSREVIIHFENKIQKAMSLFVLREVSSG